MPSPEPERRRSPLSCQAPGRVIDTVWGWQSRERVLSSKRRETCPVRELQARAPGDKQRRSSSRRPICQRICHGQSFIVHEGTRRRRRWGMDPRQPRKTNHPWFMLFLLLLLLFSVPVSLLSCGDAEQLHVTDSFSCRCRSFDCFDIFLLEHSAPSESEHCTDLNEV